MISNEISAREGIILNFIEKMGPLAWRKYQQRYPHVWVKDHSEIEDRSSFPPYISFRFQKEQAGVIATLRNLISTYEGELRWVLEPHFRENLPGANWLIAPGDVIAMRPALKNNSITVYEFFAKEYPLFGPVAYLDLDGLAMHFKKNIK
ncbi:hypothetical protein O9570_04115 [Achromobacter xylosoxidans]|uniref:Uncharacterized protein n=1 Tax=Alcaligenes xylosoxydans xylosoxydans TaxID=85698 RepID=A0A9X3KV94_ALCXX|nr:hypothetical protein [Achromobacter xylosoxidans]MCZ8400612.1 hypothetical protein [Achromobacter xylosoxidans]